MLYFTIEKRLQDGIGKVPEAAGARWRFYRRIIVGYPRIVFLLAEALQGVSDEILSFKISWQAQYLVKLEGDFSCSAHWKWRFICAADRWWHWFCLAGAAFGEVGCWLYLLRALEMTFHMWCGSSMTLILCGRRSIWWGWMLTVLAPRIGNDVAYVMRIVDDIDFVWQAQYLVRLEGDFSWQAQHVGTFWEIAGARTVVFYNTKASPRWDRGRSPKRRVRDDDFIVGYRRIIVGLSSDILESLYWRKHFREFPMKSWASRFRGRCSIWWGWRVTLVAPRIGNDVSYVTQIAGDIDFAWQAQHLVRLEGDFACSAHWKWRFICVADHWWHSFCVAGAVFGEVGGWHCLLQTMDMTFHMWWGSRMRFILRGRRNICWVWRVTWLAPPIGNDVSQHL